MALTRRALLTRSTVEALKRWSVETARVVKRTDARSARRPPGYYNVGLPVRFNVSTFQRSNARPPGASPRRAFLPAALSIIAVLSLAVPARGQATVQQVVVELTFDGAGPHRIIRDRLEATVASVAERLLLGRSLEQVTTLLPRPEETIASVVERVAGGYVVSEAVVRPGSVTTVGVRLRPVGAVVRDVVVIPDLRTVHPRVQPLMAALLQPGPVTELRALVTALPVASLEWTAPLVELRARDVVETALPGFTATARIRPGESAQFDLAIVPRDSRVVRNIGVRFRSTSIPIILLDQHGPQVASMADPLRGLPVAFAEAVRRSLERMLNEQLAAYPPAAEYNIVATSRLEVAETTYVTVSAESLVYRARVEARLNIGPSAPGPEVVAHLGRLIAPPLEPFLEVRLVPTPLALTADLGLRYEVSPASSVGATYAPSTQETTLWTTLQVSRDLGLRGGWTLPTQVFEGTLTYRINEFLVWELIGTSRGDVWLRLTSNL